MTKRQEFSRKTKAKAFERCKGFCESCGVKLTVGKYHYDHEIPDALGGENVLENCKVLCTACHGTKTATEDVPRIAKAARQHDRFHGIIRPKGTLRGQGFNKPPPQQRATGQVNKWRGF
jgi:5-methylcytosine-specific restriction endonuclease McrA